MARLVGSLVLGTPPSQGIPVPNESRLPFLRPDVLVLEDADKTAATSKSNAGWVGGF